MFLANQWYVAAESSELSDAPLKRTICGDPVVLYRKNDGGPVAMLDMCPHRLAPLSLGGVEGDNIRCNYHGLVFNPEGRCVRLPGQAHIPGAVAVERIFAVTERYGFVWLWWGERDKSDIAQLPDLHWLEEEGLASTPTNFRIACNWQLLVDNLMDLTHEAYVHPDSIGQEELLDAPLRAYSAGGKAFLERRMRDVEPAPFWRRAMVQRGLNADKVDRLQTCEFRLPSSVVIHGGVAPTDEAGELLSEAGVGWTVINLITPETEGSTRYYLTMARCWDLEPSEEQTAFYIEAARHLVGQDIDFLESQQSLINAAPDRKMMSLAIDAGASRARQLIEKARKAQLNGGAAADWSEMADVFT